MAGVWPWMERRRLACGDHLGKLVVEVGDKDTRRGQWALCGLRSLLRAGQLDRLDRLGTWVGGTRPREGRVSGRKEDRFPPTSQHRDLGSGPWEGRGKPRACSQLWRGAVPDPADNGQHQTGRSGHKFPLYYSCQGKTRPCRSGRLGTGSW